MEKIISLVKQKYELRNLPDSLVEKTIKDYLSKNKLNIPKSEKELKLIVKEVRAELRRYAGQYATKSNIKKRESLLSSGNIDHLLKEHASTRERINDYGLVNNTISIINPKIILDLGCGINPLAIAKKSMKYYAYDINENDLNVVKEFFRLHGIDGHTFHKDIRYENTFPKADLCIIFKVLDILGGEKYEITKRLLSIDSRVFIISFATRTLTGKPMNSPYRRWFERILNELNFSYQIKRTSQELFYIIQKN